MIWFRVCRSTLGGRSCLQDSDRSNGSTTNHVMNVSTSLAVFFFFSLGLLVTFPVWAYCTTSRHWAPSRISLFAFRTCFYSFVICALDMLLIKSTNLLTFSYLFTECVKICCTIPLHRRSIFYVVYLAHVFHSYNSTFFDIFISVFCWLLAFNFLKHFIVLVNLPMFGPYCVDSIS